MDPKYALDPDLANLPLRGEMGNKTDVKVVQFDGVPESYKNGNNRWLPTWCNMERRNTMTVFCEIF